MIMPESEGGIPKNAFQFLTSDEYVQLRPFISPRVLEKGKELFHAGELAENIFFLETGMLAVLKETGFNDRTQVVALLEPGASVGEGGLLDNFFRSATIVAIEESLLYCFERQGLKALEEKNPFLLLKIIKRLLYAVNMRLQKSSERLAHIL